MVLFGIVTTGRKEAKLSKRKPAPPKVKRDIGCFAFIYKITSEKSYEILFVLQKETDQNLYALPGGGPKKRESARKAATREVREETQLEVVLAKKPIARLKRIDRFAKMIVFDTISFENEAQADGDEIVECRWMTLAEIIANRELFKRHHFFATIEILEAKLSAQPKKINRTVKKKTPTNKAHYLAKALDQR